MNNNDKKIIVFKSNSNNEKLGEKCYVKFLDTYKKVAIFYKPLIAPKYFRHYLEENSIYEAYLITDNNILKENLDKLYTFTSSGGVYNVQKGIKEEEKYILLVDPGMEICLNLPIYSYKLDDNFIILNKYKDGVTNKKFCYVAGSDVNDKLKEFMTLTYEVIPNTLSFESYEKMMKTNDKKLNLIKK